ncbi:MAG: DUF2177 family protein, partial [Alphaproteobacteria bacterium]|nr:DUF2177 family protein [Alphaproteobacteria bacterium]
LGVIARKFYAAEAGHLMRRRPNWVPAGMFYLAFIAIILYLAVLPAALFQSDGLAALHGALLGLAAYGTYNATNLAVLKDWPARLSLVDTLWGTSLTTVSALAGLWAFKLAQ